MRYLQDVKETLEARKANNSRLIEAEEEKSKKQGRASLAFGTVGMGAVGIAQRLGEAKKAPRVKAGLYVVAAVSGALTVKSLHVLDQSEQVVQATRQDTLEVDSAIRMTEVVDLSLQMEALANLARLVAEEVTESQDQRPD